MAIKPFNLTDNQFLKLSMTGFVLNILFLMSGCAPLTGVNDKLLLNDVHSRLNPTRVEKFFYPKSTDDIIQIVKYAKKRGLPISISGGRHAMGGQQFGQGTIHMNMTKFNDVISLDRKRGIVRVEAGIGWPKLIHYLLEEQKGQEFQWNIIQKQTGADNLSLGGALSANAHGKGVRFKPIIQDVESFTLINADGELLTVSRTENKELFQLVIGGYGLFGVIATVDLHLQPRIKLQRVVEVISTDELPQKTKQKLDEGFLYGDFQYKTDEKADDFMKVGIFSAYKPVANDTPIPQQQKRLTPDQWKDLVVLAHTDKKKVFDIYSQHYLRTNGQVYWSEEIQMGFYDDQYVEHLKKKVPDMKTGSLMITEVYVPRGRINDFIEGVRGDAREYDFNIIYGTMRLIEKDEESFLAWAKENYACVIFNLHVEHSPEGIEKAKSDFQRIIDRALAMGGSYYLTYHRWARKDQVLQAYPQFPKFLKLKLKYDPEERFQSEWYRYYKKMFEAEMTL